VKLPTDSAEKYILTRFGGAKKITDGPSTGAAS
jgi:hypothetical protein